MIEILYQKLKYLKLLSPKKKNVRLSNLENQKEKSQEFLVFSNNLF